MVGQLDRMHDALLAIGDAKRSKAERLRARQSCLADSSALARLIREAGGTQKLVSMPWKDAALSQMNYDISAARDVYLMYCYYGESLPGAGTLDTGHADARDILARLR